MIYQRYYKRAIEGAAGRGGLVLAGSKVPLGGVYWVDDFRGPRVNLAG